MEHQQSEDDLCHAGVDSIATHERVSVSQDMTLTRREAAIDLRHTTIYATVLPLDTDVEMHDGTLNCTAGTNSLQREPEGICLDEPVAETVHASFSGELCLPCQKGSDASTPSAADYMPNTCEQQTPLSHSSHPRPQLQQFLHVEIWNSHPMETARHLVRAVRETASKQIQSSCHPSLASGPWHLDGTTLCIDIQEAEKIPVFVGYSTFRVFEGQLFQSITLAQGSTILPLAKKPGGRSYKATKQHGHGAKRVGKTHQVQSTTNGRGQILHEQKQNLVRLREEGYTWNENAGRFPSKKRVHSRMFITPS